MNHVYKNGDVLYHHGVKGMRWGVRKYQNKDGSLTASGKKKYSKQLYKDLQKDPYKIGSGLHNNKKIIEAISNDKRLVDATKKLKSTKYDGPDKEYDPHLDSKVVKKAVSKFEKDMKRKFNPENRQDNKILDHYIDDAADKSGAYKKAEKMNKAPNWDKAYDHYKKVGKQVVDDYIGSMGDKIVKTRMGETKYRNVVEDILFDREYMS